MKSPMSQTAAARAKAASGRDSGSAGPLRSLVASGYGVTVLGLISLDPPVPEAGAEALELARKIMTLERDVLLNRLLQSRV